MEGSNQWSKSEAQARQSFEQRLRARPGDRETMINLATLLATKLELDEARNYLLNAAVGISNDKNCAILLRKLASAKLAIWRGMRSDDTGDYIITGKERNGYAVEAVEFFQQAMCYPENSEDPVALIEGASGKLAMGDLVGALKDFSSLIADFPDYPNLNTAIFRAACLLMVLGEKDQAMQYLAYILEDPPLNVGAGELEIRALLIVCSVESDKVKRDGIRRMYTAMADALLRCEIRKELPEGFAATPPKDLAFAKWGAPWRLLVDRMLARCDYVAAAEFLRTLIRKEKTAENLVLMGEIRYMLGDPDRALENMEAAYELNPSFLPTQEHLLEWDNDTWAPRLDAAAYAAKVAREKAEELERRHKEADRRGRILKEHVERQRWRSTLEFWYNTWERHYAATLIQRIARGRAARILAIRKLQENGVLLFKTKKVVKKINAHLLRHVVRSWNRYWFQMATKRRTQVKPLARRISGKLMKAVFQAWHHRARRQVMGRVSAKRAMVGLKTWTGRGRRRKTVRSEEIPIFYSNSLNSLARIPLDRASHETSVKHVIAEKIRTAELLAETKAQEELEDILREEREALEAAADLVDEDGADIPQSENENEMIGEKELMDMELTTSTQSLGTTMMNTTGEMKKTRKSRVRIAPEPVS